jgi:ligand-binding SRPBCC domain-containing protein
MPKIIVQTRIAAPPEVCFDLARDIGLHCRSTSHTNERAIAGVTTGLIELGESVTFEGVHFGIRQRFTARVTEFQRPEYFVDEMTQGAFQSMRHRHEFIAVGKSTLMRDIVEWRSPLGVLGHVADALFLKRYMRRFIRKRGQFLSCVVASKLTHIECSEAGLRSSEYR